MRQVKTETAIRRWTSNDGQEEERIALLALRYFFPQELEALLHYNGFAIETMRGGFEGEPLDRYAESQVIVAKRRPRTSR